MKLTELPKDIIDLISKSEIKVSIGEELLPIVDKNIQSKLTETIQQRQLSSRMVRKLVKKLGTKNLELTSIRSKTNMKSLPLNGPLRIGYCMLVTMDIFCLFKFKIIQITYVTNVNVTKKRFPGR
jgi:hypothetical protein